MSEKFTKDAEALIELVGGKENVASVSHCVSRMRFILKDTKRANLEEIEKLKSVKGTFTSAGQFQVIIGNNVAEFYKEFINVTGMEATSMDDAKEAAKQNMTLIQRLLADLAEIFSPLIPALIIGGLILGFRNILEGIEFGGWTITQRSDFWNGVNHFLWLPAEAIFHFLPVGVVWSVVKKMGGSQILGIVLGITLVSPQLANAWGVAGADILPQWDFGFIRVNMIGYQGQVIPALMAAFALVYLERWARKISPESIAMIVVPFLSLLPAVMAAHFILGPIGWTIGEAISNVVNWGLAGTFGFLFAAVFGFLYAPLVITGLHHMFLAIDLQLIADVGGTNLWPMVALSNIAQGSAVLAIIYLYRKNNEVKQVAVPACISAYLGVTEPAMFGVNLKFGFSFLAAIIGSAVAAIFINISDVWANSVGVGGLPALISIRPGLAWLWFAIGMVIAIVVPFLLTIVFSKTKLNKMAVQN